jgi:hypothetical protein
MHPDIAIQHCPGDLQGDTGEGRLCDLVTLLLRALLPLLFRRILRSENGA